MELTRDFTETIRARAKREPAFRKALLDEAIDCIRSGEASIGNKIMLRDLRGFPDEVNEARAKAKLTSRIVTLIRARRLTQVQAAALLKIDQPKLAALKKEQVSQFSIATLRRYLRLLSAQG